MSISTPTQTPTQTIHRHRLGAFGRAWLSAVKSLLSIKARGQWLPAVKSFLSMKIRGRSLREGFLGRESPWKPGSGAVEGEVTIKGGRIQRGFACLYCMRNGRKLQHWGSVSCFLTPKEREAVHFFFMNAHVGRLLRLKSAAIAAAANREGGSSWGAG